MRWSALASAVMFGLLVQYPSASHSPANTLSNWIDFAWYRGALDAQVRAQHARTELDRDAWSARRLYGHYFWWDTQ